MVSLSLIAHRHRRSFLAFAVLCLTCITMLRVGASPSVAQTSAQSVLRDLSTGTSSSSTLSCSIDTAGRVTADWLRVHVTPAVSSPVIGQIPRGGIFHYCSTSAEAGAFYWVYGYGYHGSTRLNGWVSGEYLWP
jgi:hypothetical protein